MANVPQHLIRRYLSYTPFRGEKHTAQLSVHPYPYMRTQVIMGFAMVERTADCNKVREDVVRLIYLYLGKHDILFGLLLLRK